jgi:hypothetical protein
MQESRLNLVYNNSEVIINAGFTMQSNYIVPMLSRMIDEGIINYSAQTLVQTILSYKHTEENPFPSRDELARVLGKSVSYVKKGLKSITEAGILAIEKAGRKNTYSFKPFFALLEKFIIEYKQNKNYDVKIADLMNVKVQKKEAGSFEWSEEYAGEKEIVPAEETESPVEEVVEEVVPVLPEEISKVTEVYGVDAEGIEAIEKAYTAYSGKLKDAVFIEKIIASVGKKGFVNYFNRCITTAYTNNEQPKQAPVQKGGYAPHHDMTRKPIRKEILPEWMDENYDAEEARKKNEKQKREELVERIAQLEKLASSDLMKNNKSVHEQLAKTKDELRFMDLPFEEKKKEMEAKLKELHSDKEGVK